MSKIAQAFEHGKAFIGFITGGYPNLEKTEEFVLEMVRAGADLIEIGIPFSDPVAEGPVIQYASSKALEAGTDLGGLFNLVRSLRVQTQVPMVFMTYLNPVFHYGYQRFFQRCQELGLDGIIIPDLPYEEKQEIASVCDAHGVDLISMIAPTSRERIGMIAAEARGFLYVVSSMGVTGIREEIGPEIVAMTESARAATGIPLAVGFGVNTPEQAKEMARYADGVIVGSGIVKIVTDHGSGAGPYIYEFVRSMKDALKEVSGE